MESDGIVVPDYDEKKGSGGLSDDALGSSEGDRPSWAPPKGRHRVFRIAIIIIISACASRIAKNAGANPIAAALVSAVVIVVHVLAVARMFASDFVQSRGGGGGHWVQDRERLGPILCHSLSHAIGHFLA